MICTIVQGLLKESHGHRISFQLSCLLFSHFNTDSQVVGNEHMLTCQRRFHLFVIVEDLKEVVFVVVDFFFPYYTLIQYNAR